MEKWLHRLIRAQPGFVYVGIVPLPVSVPPHWHSQHQARAAALCGTVPSARGWCVGSASHPCPEQPSWVFRAIESNLSFVRTATEGWAGRR